MVGIPFSYTITASNYPTSFNATGLPAGLAVDTTTGVISGTAKRLSGHAPPVIDTLLAATALEHDLYLVTRNVRDVRASGAAVFDPWADDPAKFPLSPLASPRG